LVIRESFREALHFIEFLQIVGNKVLGIDKFFEKSEAMSRLDFDFGFWIDFISELIILSVVIEDSI
jgi:hypothetical protein